MQRPDEKIEEFHLWAQMDEGRSWFVVALVLASALVVLAVAAIAIAGWL